VIWALPLRELASASPVVRGAWWSCSRAHESSRRFFAGASIQLLRFTLEAVGTDLAVTRERCPPDSGQRAENVSRRNWLLADSRRFTGRVHTPLGARFARAGRGSGARAKQTCRWNCGGQRHCCDNDPLTPRRAVPDRAHGVRYEGVRDLPTRLRVLPILTGDRRRGRPQRTRRAVSSLSFFDSALAGSISSVASATRSSPGEQRVDKLVAMLALGVNPRTPRRWYANAVRTTALGAPQPPRRGAPRGPS